MSTEATGDGRPDLVDAAELAAAEGAEPTATAVADPTSDAPRLEADVPHLATDAPHPAAVVPDRVVEVPEPGSEVPGAEVPGAIAEMPDPALSPEEASQPGETPQPGDTLESAECSLIAESSDSGERDPDEGDETYGFDEDSEYFEDSEDDAQEGVLGPDDDDEALGYADHEGYESGQDTVPLRARRWPKVLLTLGSVVVAAAIAGGAVVIVGSFTHGFKKPVKVIYKTSAVFSLKTGDCFDPQGQQSYTLISCDSPHQAEVFATFALNGTKWPGNTAVQATATSGCAGRLTGYVNPQLAIGLTSSYVYPDSVAWQAGTRTVICEVRATSGQLTGSVRGASASAGLASRSLPRGAQGYPWTGSAPGERWQTGTMLLI